MQSIISLLALGAIIPAVLAKTDIAGCTSSKTVAFGGASMVYWVPGTGEICELLDCGGGRAPPKTNVPGCAAYEGTDVYTPRYMEGYGPHGHAEASTTAIDVVSTFVPVVPEFTEAHSIHHSLPTKGSSMDIHPSPTPSVSPLATPSVIMSAHSTLITAAPSTTAMIHHTPAPTTPGSPSSSPKPPPFNSAASMGGRSVVGVLMGAAAAALFL